RQERASEQAARVESESRAEQLATELAVIQAEALRLREDRARVLAAVDDESAEPAAVVRALRERLAGVEGQLEAYAAERAAHGRTVEETVSEHRRLGEEIARAHRSELAELATAHERALTERGAEITRLDSERRAMLKQAETLRAVLAAAQARDAAQRARG